MVRVGITGAAGRMGRMLVQAVHESEGLWLAAAIERPGHDSLGRDPAELAGVPASGIAITDDLPQALNGIDTLVDFSVPDSTLAALQGCVASNTAIVIGTTGFDDAGLDAIRAASARIPVFMAPNMSPGVNLVFKLLQIAAQALGDEADVEIFEAHHRHKIDAPSGTAVRMGEIVAQALGRDLSQVANYGREGITGARDDKTIGFQALRGGDIVGDHTVYFAAPGERIEITHRASSRMNFALGAMRAVRFIAEKPPGLYDMQGALGLD